MTDLIYRIWKEWFKAVFFSWFQYVEYSFYASFLWWGRPLQNRICLGVILSWLTGYRVGLQCKVRCFGVCDSLYMLLCVYIWDIISSEVCVICLCMCEIWICQGLCVCAPGFSCLRECVCICDICISECATYGHVFVCAVLCVCAFI